MVKELIVVDGKLRPSVPNVQASLLGQVDAMGKSGKEALYENDATKSSSNGAKRLAIKKAKEFENKGWKNVTIRGIYSYGNDNPYRYDIESWGGYEGN